MSLYDDIGLDRKEIAESNSDVSGWSVGHRLLHSHTKSKKSSGLGGSSSSYSRKRGSSGLAPVVDLNNRGGSRDYGGGGGGGGGGSAAQGDGEIRFNHITGKMETGAAPRSYAQFGVSTHPVNSPFADMSVEYDPSYPNEYADFAKRLKEQKSVEREEERRREDEERRRRRDEERKEKLAKMASSFKPPTNLYNEPPAAATPTAPKETESTKRLALYDSSSDSEDDSKSSGKRTVTGGAEFAPPVALLEEPKPATPPPPGFKEEATDEGFSIGGKGGSVASKIMAKMGYKHGSGLGREEQGMSMALQVEKTSRRGGKILHERDIATKEAAMASTVKADTGVTNMELLKNPSKVLLLMNMVGPGEVDDDLEPETAEECEKYGKVIKCVIFEVMNVPDTEAVRIFVEFEKISFAIKAAIDLNGRYFGGRVVRAAFYSHEKFLNMQLADEPM